MDVRVCDYCGAGLVLVRADARFCSTKCRVYAARRAKKSPAFPAELINSPRWMRWKMVSRRGRETKVPLTASGMVGSSTNPEKWATFAEAQKSSQGVGLGFALNGDGIGCVDLDHCIVDGVIADWAQEIIDANPGTFTEISTSGTGVHIWGILSDRPGRVIRDGRNIEVYANGRYIAMGSPMPGTKAALLPLNI